MLHIPPGKAAGTVIPLGIFFGSCEGINSDSLVCLRATSNLHIEEARGSIIKGNW